MIKALMLAVVFCANDIPRDSHDAHGLPTVLRCFIPEIYNADQEAPIAAIPDHPAPIRYGDKRHPIFSVLKDSVAVVVRSLHRRQQPILNFEGSNFNLNSVFAKETDYDGGPQHTFGPIRHLPLGIQVLFGGLLIAVALFSLLIAFQRFLNGRLGPAFFVVFFGSIMLSVCGLMITVGGLVAL